MKKIIIVTLAMVLCVGISQVHAAMDWDFYEDGTIDPCDEYWNVGVYDTPPDHTTVDMSGGLVDSIGAYDESTVNISGGYVSTIGAFDFSNVNVFGGSVRGLHAYDTGIVNVSGNADVFSLVSSEYGVVNISGGSVDHFAALDFGTVNLSGGSGFDYLVAENSGLINIFGYDLSKTDIGGGYGYGFVSGEWAEGTIFNIDFSVSGAYSRVVLYEIPEPATLAIVLAGVLFLRKRSSFA